MSLARETWLRNGARHGEYLALARHVNGRGVASGSPDAGEASGNDGRGRGEKARRALSAADRDPDGKLAWENGSESSLTDRDLAEGRFLCHKSSLLTKHYQKTLSYSFDLNKIKRNK
jgi:hypothetical protein